MDHIFIQMTAMLRRMWKYRWTGLLVAWIAGAIGVVVSFTIPNRYEASARIYVDTQSILKPLMSGLAVQPNVDLQVGMLSRTLISRPNIEKLIRMADMDLKSQTKSEQEALIEMLMKELKINSTGRDNLYTLSYKDTDPDAAKRVVQAFVSIFVESSLGASRKDTATAATFINEQIKSYEAKLEEAEGRLKEFRLRNIQLMAGDGRDSAARLGDLSTQLERARLELREATNARDAAKLQLDAERTRGGNPSAQGLLQESALSISTPEIDARLDAQRRNLDSLLQRYTEQHPDVIAARKLIKDLEDQKKKEVSELRKGSGGMAYPEGNSLVRQELMKLLAGAEVQVAQMKARVDEYSARYAQALASLKTAPQIEAEAAQLNRDYAVHKKNYEDLVARRESAAISGELDVASGVADFKVIDPPRVNPRAVAPNRLLLLAGSLAAALGLGLAAAFAASQLRPVFFDSVELAAVTQLPILGVVSALQTEHDLRVSRRDAIRFWFGSSALVLIFGVGLIVVAIINNRAVSA